MVNLLAKKVLENRPKTLGAMTRTPTIHGQESLSRQPLRHRLA